MSSDDEGRPRRSENPEKRKYVEFLNESMKVVMRERPIIPKHDEITLMHRLLENVSLTEFYALFLLYYVLHKNRVIIHCAPLF